MLFLYTIIEKSIFMELQNYVIKNWFLAFFNMVLKPYTALNIFKVFNIFYDYRYWKHYGFSGFIFELCFWHSWDSRILSGILYWN